MAKEEQNKICDICGGTGQLSYFKGVSRFLLSHDECPDCAGTGFQLYPDESKIENPNPAEKKKEEK